MIDRHIDDCLANGRELPYCPSCDRDISDPDEFMIGADGSLYCVHCAIRCIHCDGEESPTVVGTAWRYDGDCDFYVCTECE